MHVNAGRIATAGLLAGVATVMMVLSSVIETSSLFFIAAASFCVGIAIREWGIWFGTAFGIAVVFLNLIVAPDKMKCITLAGMDLYLLLSECLWIKIANAAKMKHRMLSFWLGKYAIFNILYIPILLFLPSLVITKRPTVLMLGFVWGIGQIVLWIYDNAHSYFQNVMWGKLRSKIMK